MYPDPFVVHFLSFYPRPRGLRLLDAGCGAGRNAAYLASHGVQVTALDSSLRQAQACVANAPTARVAVGSVTDLPFDNMLFDAAICTSVLEYLDGDQAAAAAAELQHVLSPRGRLLVVTAAAEGSEPGYGRGPSRAAGTVARLTSRADLQQWFGGVETIELLHLQLEEPASAPVRAQWALIARKR